MPSYALLGATGATGSAILRCLLSEPLNDLVLKLFVRSKSKLVKAFPDLTSTTAARINIVEGTPSDDKAIQECLRDVDVVFMCIGSNHSTPGMSIIYDTATAIINALEVHQKNQGSAYKPPTILQLRASVLNPILRAAQPWVGRQLPSFCFRHIYKDLDQACKLFVSSAAASPPLLHFIFIDPPSLHDAEGTTPTGYKLILEGKQIPVLSYADLGVAFCEVAERRGEFEGKGVGVVATGTVNVTWGTSVRYMATGIKSRLWG